MNEYTVSQQLTMEAAIRYLDTATHYLESLHLDKEVDQVANIADTVRKMLDGGK